MKISVALCTYNGSRYLQEQLHSIVGQSRQPDEIVVCDDSSNDSTVEMLNRFERDSGLCVRIHRNEQTLGSTKNFEQAIAHCDGDLIVLCDQDDVWEDDKIQCLEEAMERNPKAAYVFSDAHVVDEYLHPVGHTLWEAVGFGRRERRLVELGQAATVLLRYNVATGATMAFRAKHKQLILPIPEGWIHDGWSALVLAMVAPCTFVDKPLIRYRQHTAQQLGGAKTTFLEKVKIAKSQDSTTFQLIADDYQHVLDRVRQFRESLLDPCWLTELENKVNHFRAKARMRKGKRYRLPLVAREALSHHYGRYSRGWKSLAQDIFL